METSVSNGTYRSTWNDCHVNFYSGPRPQMPGFHMHDFYEIHLVLSGEIDVFFADSSHKCNAPVLILNKPLTPHFITGNQHYTRYCLCFSHDFASNYLPEWTYFSIAFGKVGNIIKITPEHAKELEHLLKNLNTETSLFRQRLMLYYILSYISDISPINNTSADTPPPYILNALSYINEHFAEKIVASELAWTLGICRTTLMTAFKKHTGSTLNDYITLCRLNHAIRLLNSGKTEQEVAELCGFCAPYGLIRAFKKVYNMTPRQFIATNPLQ